MIAVKLIEQRFEIKPGTSTVWELKEDETKEIDFATVDRIVDGSPFFRRLGGSETLTRGYTCAGYKPVMLVSKSPDRSRMTVRRFEYIDKPRNRITVKVTFEDGNTTTTDIFTDLDGAKEYYLGKYFNFGDSDEHPQDLMVKAVKVEEIQ